MYMAREFRFCNELGTKDACSETSRVFLSKCVLLLSRTQVSESHLRGGTRDLQVWKLLLLTNLLLKRSWLLSWSATFRIYANATCGTIDDHLSVDCQIIFFYDYFNLLTLQTFHIQINCQITLIYQLILLQMSCSNSPYVYS